jgi:hypothetical protein
MTGRTRFSLTMTAFCLLYFSVMGSMIVASTPLLDGIKAGILRFVMLPAAIAGLGLVIFEKIQVPTD